MVAGGSLGGRRAAAGRWIAVGRSLENNWMVVGWCVGWSRGGRWVVVGWFLGGRWMVAGLSLD
eukprot:11187906-Lingulodinium_polyedra.AAC.1